MFSCRPEQGESNVVEKNRRCLWPGRCSPSADARANSRSTKRLAFITNNAADFWTIARKGTEKADAELADVDVEFRLGDGTAAEQKRIVDDLLAKGVDGIAISPSIRPIRRRC